MLGFWKCLKCRKEWKSSKTWILLEKWRNGVPFSKINEEYLIQQKCPKCNNEINKISLCTNLQEKDLDKTSKRKEKIEKKDKKKPTKWLEDRIESLENKKENLSEKSLNKLEVLKKALQKINDQNLDVKS